MRKNIWMVLVVIKEKMKMKKDMKKLAAIFLAVIMIMINAFPAFAATTSVAKNAAGGYSIPASITLQVGEQKKLTVTQPAGKYAKVYIQFTSNIVTTSGYYGGAYWGKKAETTITGKTPGTFTEVVYVYVYRKPVLPVVSKTGHIGRTKTGPCIVQRPGFRSSFMLS